MSIIDSMELLAGGVGVLISLAGTGVLIWRVQANMNQRWQKQLESSMASTRMAWEAQAATLEDAYKSEKADTESLQARVTAQDKRLTEQKAIISKLRTELDTVLETLKRVQQSLNKKEVENAQLRDANGQLRQANATLSVENGQLKERVSAYRDALSLVNGKHEDESEA